MTQQKDQPLQIKYRFKTLEEFWGNDELRLMLSTKMASQAPPNTFFFFGQKGCGKTSLARIVAEWFGCDMESDYQELNISQVGGKDESGRIQQEMHWMPRGQARVYCLDECQEASRQFFQGMLKATEEPPAHVKFVFCTTDPKKLPEALLRRGPIFEVQPVSGPVMRDLLWGVLEQEGLGQANGFPQEVVDEIVVQAEGSPGVALKLLDQVIDITDPDAMVRAVRSMNLSLEGQATANELFKILLRGPGKNLDAAWRQVSGLIQKLPKGEDSEKIRRYMFAAAEGELLRTGQEQAGIICNCFERPFYDNAGKGLVFASWKSLR